MSTPPASAPIPPQNLDAEESVLGAMMLSPGAITAVTELLVPEDFYRGSHARIFQAAATLAANGEPVDAITLSDFLEERGELEDVGGRMRVHELAALVPATANAAHYARIIAEMATLRGLIRCGSEIARLGWERPGETAELVDQAERIVFELAQARSGSKEFAALVEILRASLERLGLFYAAGSALTGSPSGFRELDRLTAGFQPGNLVILAARPSQGKSALALNVAAHLTVRHKTPVCLFTLEMSEGEVAMRLLCSEARVESQRLRAGRLGAADWDRLLPAAQGLAEAPLYVDDSGSVNLLEMRSKLRRLVAREPQLGLVIVDYLQLMTTEKRPENRVQEVSAITRQLKLLARELELPLLALSQLSRQPEGRPDKRPILSDLRDSGSLEQDADVVLFVYRDAYYNDESDQQGLAELNVAKHRNGPTDSVKLAFLKRWATFSDLAPAH